MKVRALVAFCFGAIFIHNSLGQDVGALYNDAMAAYKQKNYATFIAKTEEMLRLRPHHERYMYNLAAGYALTDANRKPSRCCRRLRRWDSFIPTSKRIRILPRSAVNLISMSR